MSHCAWVNLTPRGNLILCDEDPTRTVFYANGISKTYCPYHERQERMRLDKEREERDLRYAAHRQFVSSFSSAGVEALKQLQKELSGC